MRLWAGLTSTRLWRISACAVRNYGADNCSNTAAALAFYCAFSLAPLLVILLTIAEPVLGKRSAYNGIESRLAALFGPATSKVLLGAAYSVQHARSAFPAIISVVALLIGATTVLGALQQALEKMWRSTHLSVKGVYGWIRTRLMSLGFILTLGFLLLLSLGVSTTLAGIQARIAASYPLLVHTVEALDIVVSLVIVAILFALVYRYLPARRLPWRAVLVGGLLTAVLFDIGHRVIGLYLARSTEPSVYGAASSFVALLLWLYYSALIVLFGAEFTACLGGARDEATRA